MFVLLSNGLQQVSVILRTIWTKFGAEPQLRAPFLAAGRGVSHDRFDADLLESFSHFFHLARAPSTHSNMSASRPFTTMLRNILVAAAVPTFSEITSSRIP